MTIGKLTYAVSVLQQMHVDVVVVLRKGAKLFDYFIHKSIVYVIWQLW